MFFSKKRSIGRKQETHPKTGDNQSSETKIDLTKMTAISTLGSHFWRPSQPISTKLWGLQDPIIDNTTSDLSSSQATDGPDFFPPNLPRFSCCLRNRQKTHGPVLQAFLFFDEKIIWIFCFGKRRRILFSKKHRARFRKISHKVFLGENIFLVNTKNYMQLQQ